MNPKLMVASLMATGLIGSAAIGYSAGSHSSLSRIGASITAPAAVATSPAMRLALPDFSAIAVKYGRAVVNVSVTQEVKPAASAPELPQLDPDDPFNQFFKRFQAPMPRGGMPLHGIGSGFIVSSDGVILTNAHVVDGAKQVDVKLTDKREFRAKVIGVDKESDVAVLKIDASNLPTVKLGNPADVKPGDWVLAIGSPFGFENTVTQGIVSAKSRTLPDETYVPFIQTDVPVNPGNSGGPLFDMKGEVIGINSQIYSHSGGYEGLSFAIPIDIASHAQAQLLQHGIVTRARLGVTIQDMTKGLADSFGLKNPTGALVSNVEPGSPAAKAGLEPGDVIVKLNDKQITDSAELPAQVADMKPGTSVELDVFRHGNTKNLNVTLGELKAAQVASAAMGQHSNGGLGLTVRPLTPQERAEAGSGGLLVEDATGHAAQAGIEPGDVIVSLNGMPIKSAEQFRKLIAKAGKHFALLVQRDAFRIFVPMDLG